jgi:rubrerythrin
LNYTAYERFETRQDVEDVLQDIYSGLETLLDTFDENRDEIESHLIETFAGESESDVREAIQDLFDAPSELEQKVLRRLFKFYSSFRALENESGQGVEGLQRRRVIQEELLRELERETGYFPMLLSQAGLVSQYRSTEDSVALFREEKDDDSRIHLSYESKSISQAMRESYPKAMDTYGGVDYEVVSAQVSQRTLFTTSICINQACVLPFNDYPDNLEFCPLCDDELESIDVHEYLGAILRSSQSRKRTRALVMRGVDID